MLQRPRPTPYIYNGDHEEKGLAAISKVWKLFPQKRVLSVLSWLDPLCKLFQFTNIKNIFVNILMGVARMLAIDNSSIRLKRWLIEHICIFKCSFHLLYDSLEPGGDDFEMKVGFFFCFLSQDSMKACSSNISLCFFYWRRHCCDDKYVKGVSHTRKTLSRSFQPTSVFVLG